MWKFSSWTSKALKKLKKEVLIQIIIDAAFIEFIVHQFWRRNGPQFCPCLWPWHLKNFAELISKVILWQQLFTAPKDWVKMRSYVSIDTGGVCNVHINLRCCLLLLRGFLSMRRKSIYYNVTSIYATILQPFWKKLHHHSSFWATAYFLALVVFTVFWK